MSVMNPTNTSSGLTQNNSTLIMRLIHKPNINIQKKLVFIVD